MKKLIALLLALVMCFALFAGCTTAEEEKNPNSENNQTEQKDNGKEDAGKEDPTPAGPTELVIGTINDVGSMYPGGAMTTGRKTMRVLVYEPLFWMNPETAELTPVLGKSYQSHGDGKYTIEIFDNIYDSAGNHMTAKDIVFSVNLHVEDGENPSNYETMVKCEPTGEYTLDVEFAPEVKGQFEAFVTYTLCVTQAAWEASPDEMTEYPVGTGGYNLVPEATVTGATYVFEKRDDYWQKDEQYICTRNQYNTDKVTIKVITDAATMAVELETGGIDFTTDIVATDRGNFIDAEGKALDGYSVAYGTNNAFAHISFNCGANSPCSDPYLRKAIAYAIDNAACAYTVHGAFGSPCFNATNPNLLDAGDYLNDGDYYNYNVDKAKDMLAKSSYKDETIRLLVQPNATIKPCAALIQQYCNEIGITVELISFDMAQYRKLENDKSGSSFDMKVHGLKAIDDYIFRSLEELDNRSSENGNNDLFINDPKMQELYETCADAATHSEANVKALMDYLEENCFIYGLYYGPKIFLGKENISNVICSIPEDVVYPGIVVG